MEMDKEMKKEENKAMVDKEKKKIEKIINTEMEEKKKKKQKENKKKAMETEMVTKTNPEKYLVSVD